MGPKGLEWDGRDDFGEDEFMIQMYVAPTLYNIYCIYIYIHLYNASDYMAWMICSCRFTYTIWILYTLIVYEGNVSWNLL